MEKPSNFKNLHELRLTLPNEVFQVYEQYFTNVIRMNPGKPWLEHAASSVAWMAVKRLFRQNRATGNWEKRIH